MEVKVLIIEGQKAEVKFKGMWTRRFVDIAYKNMLLNLPIHMAKIRATDATRVVEEKVIVNDRQILKREKEQDIASKQAEGKEVQNG